MIDTTPPRDDLIHETAIIEDGATIGAGTRIWHHSHVRKGAAIGDACTLGKNVFVDTAVKIGSGVKIQNNVSVYRGVELSDEVFVGPSAVFTNDRIPRASADEWEVVVTNVRRGASIGANATVVAGADIGEWAMVGAGAVVVHGAAPHEVVVGNPARRIGWVCRCGKTSLREGKGASLDCSACGTQLNDLL